jgi:serine protease inhibitor
MIDFNNRVTVLAQAVAAGNLVNDQLEVVDNGLLWKLKCFVLSLLNPICSCFGTDLFAHVRVNNVAQALLKLCRGTNVTPEIRERVVSEILNPLAVKTKGKYNLDITTIATSIRAIVQVSREETQLVQQAINDFAQQLHRRIGQNLPNSVCFAPMSIAAVLGMVLKAMPDARKAELLRVMGLENMPEAKVHASIMHILDDLGGNTGELCTVSFANGVALMPLAQAGIHPSFTETVEGNYQGQIFLTESLDVINSWVREKTQGKIENFLRAEDMPRNLGAVLLNAMYFTAKWKNEFGEPFSAPFHLANGDIQAKMMYRRGHYQLYRGDNFRMLEIPYRSPEGHELSHVIFLPNQREALPELEARFTHRFVKECRALAARQEVLVTIPKMDVTARQDGLLGMMQEMGLPLQGALPLIGAEAELVKVIHQAKLKVDERGSEGAAATAGIVLCMAGPPNMDLVLPEEFKADHNFAYFVMDKDNILFQGNVRDQNALIH